MGKRGECLEQRREAPQKRTSLILYRYPKTQIKYCIVGTINGTKVFQPGDVVEVDAYSGVVRVIDKEKP